MATFNKFNSFVDYLCKGNINLSSDSIKVMLTNTLPVATNTLKANITEITAANGYVAGGAATTITLSNSAGTETAAGTNVTVTASGGSVGPFQYAVLYDATFTGNPLIGWFDYGSAVTLNSGDSFTVAPGSGNWFTLA